MEVRILPGDPLSLAGTQPTRMHPKLRALHRRARWVALGDRMVGRGGRGSLHLIDVGSVGPLPSPWNEHASQLARLLKFEPRDRVGSRNPRVTAVDAALWSEAGERDFYVYRGKRGTGSSLYRQNLEYVRENFESLRRRGSRRLAETWFDRSSLVRTERVHCRTLDEVLREQDVPYDFLKIDAQGAEYEILRGAERFLESACLGLHLELFVLPLYAGIALLPSVETYLAGLGFERVIRYPAHGSFDSQHDCVYLRRDAIGEKPRLIRKIYGLGPA
jgi:FkbM family methyltransferase